MWVNLSPKKDKMKKTGKGLARVLTIAALGSALIVPALAPAVAAADEGSGIAPLAIIESVVDTFKTEQCLTTSSHDWEGSRTYRNNTFHTSFALDHRDIISHAVKYPCHYQTNHKATYTTWKNVYRTW